MTRKCQVRFRGRERGDVTDQPPPYPTSMTRIRLRRDAFRMVTPIFIFGASTPGTRKSDRKRLALRASISVLSAKIAICGV